MAVRETKIQLYQQMIYDEEKAKAENSLQKLSSQNESRVSKRTQELKAWKAEVIKRRESTANLRRQEILSNQEQENTEMILQRREEIVEKLLEKTKEKAAEYVKTPAYLERFTQKIESFLQNAPEEEMILQLRPEDLKKVQDLLKNSNRKIHYEDLPEGKIGGFIIQNMKRTYAIEETIANRIDRNRYEITRVLYNELEEGNGDVDDGR